MKGLLIISGLGILAMLAEIFKFKKLLLPIVLLGIVSAFVLNYFEWKTGMSFQYFDNMISFDKPAIAFSGIILATAFFWFILANDYFEEESNLVDHFALVLFALVGALMLTSFKNMTTLFLGIEIMSIPLYVLAASKKNDMRSNEAGFKYLIMGSFASAFLLFGIALIYGASGSFDIMVIRQYISAHVNDMPMFFYVGVVMMLVAMCFKVSAAPFHFWAPDVYEGSPTLITALMSTVVKTAAFAAFLRLFLIGFAEVSEVWTGILAAVVALSLIIANFSAAMQTSVKRMLAYSSISHAGFMLMVIMANVRSNMSLDAIIYYSLAYSIGSITSFGILYNVTRKGNETIDAFNGLSKRNPFLAICMTISMLSLAGIPITAGFFAKYYVFTTVIGTHYQWLLILAVITSAVGAYYYLKVIIAMYFKEQEEQDSVVMEGSNKFVIILTTAVTLIIGLAPGMIAEMFKF
ncbi:NADH-quinone oxidoreductase subunit N [Aurantibacillus circumpalustris]|uniref:NADH-quinone oxidoreductase subunit N n=1 Tax=Aurantibacillus circumpalustris TaxID=3036359 RepID=UPI00295B6080|nr:NADH-quinone oxidoreductase subunit N [Aurantibacillus circumpalustris]